MIVYWLIKIPVLFSLFFLLGLQASMIADKLEPTAILLDDPLAKAVELIHEQRPDEALLLAQFSHDHLPVQDEYSVADIENQANQLLSSTDFYIHRFSQGALTGEASDTATLLGAISIDMFVIGDIRDLIVQGYREYDTGEGDEVLIALSAAGLLLTLAPEASWVPSLFKAFWRGQRFSQSFQNEFRRTFSRARKSGDYRKIQHMFNDFSVLLNALGGGATMTLMKHARSAADLRLLASRAKKAPSEVYTLVSINGIQGMREIAHTSSKSGKLKRQVKIAARESKIFNKAMQTVPLTWLIGMFCSTLVFTVMLLAAGRKRSLPRRGIDRVPGLSMNPELKVE
jgi:hypothetical protein